MQKVEWINGMAVSVLNDENQMITNEEFEFLMAVAESDIEKELYIELYNFFLRKRSEEVIKDGKF